MQKSLRHAVPLLAFCIVLTSTQADAASSALPVVSGARLAVLTHSAALERPFRIPMPVIPRPTLPKRGIPVFPPRDRTPRQPTRPPPPPPSQTPPSDSLAQLRQKIVQLVNDERADANLAPLQMESHLQTAAQKHAEDMKSRNYFDHVTPEGKTPTDRIRAAGYPLNGTWHTGENIAKGQTTAEQVMRDWMNSPGHRANILSKNFKEIGVGFVGNYWVQNFGAHQ